MPGGAPNGFGRFDVKKEALGDCGTGFGAGKGRLVGGGLFYVGEEGKSELTGRPAPSLISRTHVLRDRLSPIRMLGSGTTPRPFPIQE